MSGAWDCEDLSDTEVGLKPESAVEPLESGSSENNMESESIGSSLELGAVRSRLVLLQGYPGTGKPRILGQLEPASHQDSLNGPGAGVCGKVE